jgi:predicted MFS family arabinose efflux permease
VNGGYYVRTATANLFGSAVYEYFDNFTIPFLVTSVMCAAILLLNLVMLPDKETSLLAKGMDGDTSNLQSSLSESGHIEYAIKSESDEDVKRDSLCDLTPAVIFPMMVTFLVDGMGGYAMTIVSPYLAEVSGISVSQGGVYVMVLTLAMSIGSMVSGLLMQKRVFSSAQMICVAALMAALGIWLLFPGPANSLLYSNLHLTAYVAQFLIGCGDMMGEMAAYKAMEDLQIRVFNRSMGAKNRSIASGLFYIMVCVGMSGGSSFSIVVLDYLNYQQGAGIMLGCMGVTFIIGIGLEITLRRNRRSDFMLIKER